MSNKWTNTRVMLAALATSVACNADSIEGESKEFGSMNLALTVQGGFELTTVDVSIKGEGDFSVSREFTLDVSDSNASASAAQNGLPPGSYTVALSGAIADEPNTDMDESALACSGSASGISVAAGEVTHADLVLTCTYDGGWVQTAGGILVTAEVETDVRNNCPDLGTALVGPLDTSVGESVSLIAAVYPGVGDVTVEWKASAGSISEGGSSYTCPDVAGTYEVTATFERADGCDQEFATRVSCHNSYAGPVAALPSTFALDGSCRHRSPCHAEQDGKAFNIVCGDSPTALNVISGEASGENSFSFIDFRAGAVCHASVVEGELVATCTNDEGETCDLVSNSSPTPDAFCPLVESLSEVQVCSGSYDGCAVAQDRCQLLFKCGETYLGRDINAESEVRVRDYDGATSYYCAAPADNNGVATGTCEATGRGASGSCNYSAEVNLVEQACEETMTREGFVLEGCGFEDDYCVGVQTGCGWRLVCASGSYGGVATGTNAFEFTGPNGSACSGSVIDGEFVGSCEDSCTFAPREAVDPGDDCMELPEFVYVDGCQNSNTLYELIQDNCTVGGVSASWGEAFSGEITDSSITWVANGNYNCKVSPSGEEGVLAGTCLPVSGQGPTCALSLTTAAASE